LCGASLMDEDVVAEADAVEAEKVTMAMACG
jgi:hypothetical protein